MSKVLIDRELLHDLADMAHDEAYRQSVGANASRPEKQAKLDKTVADAYALLAQPAAGAYSSDPMDCTGCASGCFRCLQAHPAADCGLEVVAFGYGKTVLWNQTDGPDVAYGEQLCRKSDADARDAMRLVRIAELEEDYVYLHTMFTENLAELSALKAENEALMTQSMVRGEQLLEFKVQEPVAVVEVEPDYWASGGFHNPKRHFYKGTAPYVSQKSIKHLAIGTKLYAEPVPAKAGKQEVHQCPRCGTGMEVDLTAKPMSKQEVVVTAPKPAESAKNMWDRLNEKRCMVCGELHGSTSMPCPKMIPMSIKP